MSLEPGQRVKLVPNPVGFWMACIFGCYYLDLACEPTGTVKGITVSRDAAGDLIDVAIDGHPAPGLLRPSAWGFAPGLLLPAGAGELQPAPVCEGRGRPVAVETVMADLLAYVELCDEWELLQPREQVLAQLKERYLGVSNGHRM